MEKYRKVKRENEKRCYEWKLLMHSIIITVMLFIIAQSGIGGI